MTSKYKFAAIITAGGIGKRFGSDTPKQFLELNGISILEKTINSFFDVEDIAKVFVTVPFEYLEKFHSSDTVIYIAGGQTRQQSVFNALQAIDESEFSHVLIHDAVRPFVSDILIKNIQRKLLSGSLGVVPVVAVTDTTKLLDDGLIQKTIDRDKLFKAQTPQGFDLSIIKNCHEKYKGKDFSDDSMLLEAEGVIVATIDGEEGNVKITYKEDLKMDSNSNKINDFRVGQGFDVHAFEEGDFVTLCGIQVPHTQGLKGHSDADVAWHALTDALLGAVGKGDIGEHFSEKDEKWSGADSSIFLKEAKNFVIEAGYNINNVDITIICEAPKLSEFKNEMRNNTAKCLNLQENQINVKATTTEKLGFTGRKEGISASAVVSIFR